MYHEILSVTVNVLKNVTDNISENVTSTVSINPDDKKVRCTMNCFILHTFLLVNILLFIIASISYHYAKHRPKQKNIGTLKI